MIDQKNILIHLKNKDAWFCHPSPEYKIDKSVLKNNFKINCYPSTGINHIDLDFCKKKN